MNNVCHDGLSIMSTRLALLVREKSAYPYKDLPL